MFKFLAPDGGVGKSRPPLLIPRGPGPFHNRIAKANSPRLGPGHSPFELPLKIQSFCATSDRLPVYY
jgi:hypothetical protein